MNRVPYREASGSLVPKPRQKDWLMATVSLTMAFSTTGTAAAAAVIAEHLKKRQHNLRNPNTGSCLTT